MKATMTLGLGMLLAVGAIAACKTTTEGTGGGSPGSSTSSGTVSGGGGSSTGGTSISRSQCTAACIGRATQCGASDPSALCDSVCSGSSTTSQLACLQQKSCAELQSGSLDDICPPGSTSSTTSSGGSTSSSSSSGNAGSTCTDSFDCTGFAPCYCLDGYVSTAINECVEGVCEPDCSFTCETHGGQ